MEYTHIWTQPTNVARMVDELACARSQRVPWSRVHHVALSSISKKPINGGSRLSQLAECSDRSAVRPEPFKVRQ